MSIKINVYKISEFNQYIKSDKTPYIICANIKSLFEKIVRYANNPENYSTKKKLKNILFADIQCQTFGRFIIQKTSILYITKKFV